MNIAILGVGLIGGSIGLAARARADARVSGYDTSAHVLEGALERGAIDEAASDIANAVRGAEAVFVATPVGVLAQTTRDALEHAGPDCVVSDVGSTKRVLAGAAQDERFVGGHPMAGAEGAGLGQAREDMFEGATWYLTPAKGTSGVLYERLHRLLVALGAQPAAVDAEAHDRVMACVSHLPHVLANLLVGEAESMVDRDEDVRAVFAGGAVGPSFRDATRVAGANSAIWTDIYVANSEQLVARVDATIERLTAARELLAARDAAALREWNERARGEKERLGRAEGEAESARELRIVVPNRPGVIAEIALALGRAGVNIVDMALSPSEDNRQGVVALWVRGEAQLARAQALIGELDFPVVRT
jgi:prephenate dehydrogenase